MSWWELSDGPTWNGLPLIRSIAWARPRCRLVAAGTIVESATYLSRRGHAWRCLLDDGTGRIELLFTGRPEIKGLAKGARCKVEGTITRWEGRLILWNPIYQLEEPSPS
jgi:hypothetical protein